MIRLVEPWPSLIDGGRVERVLGSHWRVSQASQAIWKQFCCNCMWPWGTLRGRSKGLRNLIERWLHLCNSEEVTIQAVWSSFFGLPHASVSSLPLLCRQTNKLPRLDSGGIILQFIAEAIKEHGCCTYLPGEGILATVCCFVCASCP